MGDGRRMDENMDMNEDTRAISAPPQPEFCEFVQTLAILRGPDGCPWDRVQTHASIAHNMLEEAYEAVAAIEDKDPEHLREELGDVLLQVVMQAQMAADAGEFTLADVARDANAKMIRRHPHVFGTKAAFEAAGLATEDLAAETIDAVESAGDVPALWDQIKAHERAQKAEAQARKRAEAGLPAHVPIGVLDDIPRQQAALAQAQAISKKAVHAGFEWQTVDDVWEKVGEEIGEFKATVPGSEQAELEFGDVLFTLVNVARKQGIDAETALRKSCAKFRARWTFMEAEAYRAGVEVSALTLEEQEALWQQAKLQEEETLHN